MVAAASPAAGQGSVRLTGTVLRRTERDTVPAAAARLVLHRLTQGGSGPIDSTVAGSTGGFLFRFPPDTAAVYLISARWAGIEYFSEPIPGRVPPPAGGVSLLVADTSSTAPLSVVARYLIVGGPDADRTRTVVDLFLLRNSGYATRVAPDSLTPHWRHALPSGTQGHQVGPSSEIAPEAMRFVGDTILVYAPISPGVDRHLMLQHTLRASARILRVPLGEGADSIQVVTEEEGIRVQGLEQVASQVIDGRPLARWAGGKPNVAPGSEVVIEFPAVAGSPERWLVPGLAAAVILVMVGAAWIARQRVPAPAPAVPSTHELIDRIARLDTAHQGRELTDAERIAYQEERGRLKQALTAALAARERPR